MTSSSASASTPKQAEDLNITIGIEFEAWLAEYRTRDLAYLQLKDNSLKKIEEALRKPIDFECRECNDIHQFSIPVRDPDETGTDDSKWQITTEEHINASKADLKALGKDEADYKVHSVEFKTRILSLNKPLETVNPSHEHVKRIDYRTEVIEALTSINTQLCKFDSMEKRKDYTLLVSPKCGLHVHIGNGEGNQLPFETVRRIFAAYTACERQIDGFHAKSRIGGTDLATRPVDVSGRCHPSSVELIDEHRVYARPLSVFMIVMAHDRQCWEEMCPLPDWPETSDEFHRREYPQTRYDDPEIRHARHGYDIDSWLTIIMRAPDLTSLNHLLWMMDRYCTLCLSNLRDTRFDVPGKTKPNRGTVEFRQHTGTLDSTTVVMYLEFLTKLVLFCHGKSNNELGELLGPGGVFRAANFDTKALCKAIGCSDDVLRFRERIESEEYRQIPSQSEVEADEAKKRGDPIAKLAKSLLDWQRDNSDPQAVHTWVTRKLTCGGYGRFDAETLDALLPNCDQAVREKLLIGYQAPIVGEPPAAEASRRIPDSASSSEAYSEPQNRFAHESDIFAGCEYSDDDTPYDFSGHGL